MLELVERYLEPIRRVSNAADAREILRRLAEEWGFRSAFLIEYEPGFTGVRMLVDTNRAREAAWAELWRTAGLSPGVGGIRIMLDMDTVVRLNPERFEGHPYQRFATDHDLLETVAVPITQAAQVAGLVSFSGHPELSKRDEITMQLLSYALFSQLRAPVVRVNRMAGEDRPKLTPREKDVMRLSASGLTSVEIAKELGMAARTVNQHVDNVALKLGTKNRTHTIAEIVRNDMLT
jgi:LuxR family transcriptional regulator, quorum-sensing system regulator BjaR1